MAVATAPSSGIVSQCYGFEGRTFPSQQALEYAKAEQLIKILQAE